jgi:hypothetical protein
MERPIVSDHVDALDAALASLRSTLAADGYGLEITGGGSRLVVSITAGATACAECLVPKDMMLGLIRQAVGPLADDVVLNYPTREKTHDRRRD